MPAWARFQPRAVCVPRPRRRPRRGNGRAQRRSVVAVPGTGWGMGAPPMTYTVDGQQYVAVATGGNRGGHHPGRRRRVGVQPERHHRRGRLAATDPDQGHPGGPAGSAGSTGWHPDRSGGDRPFDGTIDIGDYFFQPLKVAVPVGTTLTWENTGSVIHTATSEHGRLDTGDLASRESKSITHRQPGTYNYTCSPHPWMLGQLVVE